MRTKSRVEGGLSARAKDEAPWRPPMNWLDRLCYGHRTLMGIVMIVVLFGGSTALTLWLVAGAPH